MYSLFRGGAIKLLEVNMTVVGVDPLRTVKLRNNLPACPVLSSGIVLPGIWASCSNFALFVKNTGLLRSMCQFSRFTSAYVQPSHWTKVSVRLVQKTVSWFGLMEGVGSGKLSALWKVMWQHSGGEQKISPGSYKDKVSVHPWTCEGRERLCFTT